jgi:hypothetical protein
MSSLLLLQVSTSTTDTTTQYPTGLNGLYKVKLVGINYVQNNTTAVTVQLRGDTLRCPYGNTNGYLTFVSTASNESLSWPAVETNVNGWIDLQVIDLSTGVKPTNYTSAIFTFEVESIVKG